MKFNNWLKITLETRNLKASQLAHYSKVSGAEISRLLSGKREPSLKTLKKIAVALHISEEEILRVAIGHISTREKEPNKTHLSSEITKALQDPIAVKALLVTFKNKKDIKETIRALLETIPDLSPEKRQAILALCK